VKNLAREKVEKGHGPIDIDLPEAPKADAAAGGRTESESDVGAGSHCFEFMFLS
jgi:hypothetical protein